MRFLLTLCVLAAFLLFSVPMQAQVDRGICKDCDDAFSQNFDIAVGSLAFLAAVVLPYALPYALGFRHWWLTDPFRRWLIIAPLSGVLIFGGWVLLPWLAAKGKVPPMVGMAGFFGGPPSYLDCPQYLLGAGEIFSTRGLLMGLIPVGSSPAILNMNMMFASFLIMFGVCSAVYFLSYFLYARRKLGIKR